jgi:hypothetical protein
VLGATPYLRKAYGLMWKQRNMAASFKCEIWMLSIASDGKLEDQLLGFALVPLADIVMGDGKLVQEFSQTSTDLFHTPAKFVQLSLSYTGCSSLDVILISSPNKSASRVDDSRNDRVVPSQLEKIVFTDLDVETNKPELSLRNLLL